MTFRKSLIWLLIFTIIVLAATGCRKQKQSVELPEFKKNIKLSVPHLVSMFSLVRKALTLYPDMERAMQIPEEQQLPHLCDTDIFVTIFHEAGPSITGIGRQGCLQQRLLRAVLEITSDPNFKKFYMLNLGSTDVKIDVVRKREKLDVNKSLSKVRIEPGIHGLIMQDGDQTYYQLPTDYIYQAWEPQKREKSLRKARVKEQLNQLCRRGALPDNAWKQMPIYRFQTLSYLQHRPDFLPIPLYRGNVLPKNISAKDVAWAAASAGDWLGKNIEPTQRFTYWVNPTNGRKGSFFSYSMSRHAGCVYALLYLYNQTLETRFLDKGLLGLEFIMRNMKPPLLEKDLLSVRHPVFGYSEVGAAAMTLAALCELPEGQFENIGLDKSNRLARFILKMQTDEGNFYPVYLRKLAGLQPEKHPREYPGQAIFALTRYYKKNPNVDWLEGAKLAADTSIARFESDGRVDEWVLIGLAALYEIDPNPAYAQTVLKMADQFLNTQYQNDTYPDYEGGFKGSTPPRSDSASLKTRALLAAKNIAEQLGQDTAPYEKAIKTAARFILWNQYREDNSFFVGLPEEAKGAVRGGLVDPNIRMDFCGNAIFALSGAYELVKPKSEDENKDEKK